MSKDKKNARKHVPDEQIIALIKEKYTYTQIIAQLGVSSSRISLLKEKMKTEKDRAYERARAAIKRYKEEEALLRKDSAGIKH